MQGTDESREVEGGKVVERISTDCVGPAKGDHWEVIKDEEP